MGGWIAKAGSCNIGFSPVPSDGIGNIFAKGLDVKSINRRKPKIIISWKNNVSVMYLWESFLVGSITHSFAYLISSAAVKVVIGLSTITNLPPILSWLPQW